MIPTNNIQVVIHHTNGTRCLLPPTLSLTRFCGRIKHVNIIHVGTSEIDLLPQCSCIVNSNLKGYWDVDFSPWAFSWGPGLYAWFDDIHSALAHSGRSWVNSFFQAWQSFPVLCQQKMGKELEWIQLCWDCVNQSIFFFHFYYAAEEVHWSVTRLKTQHIEFGIVWTVWLEP